MRSGGIIPAVKDRMSVMKMVRFLDDVFEGGRLLSMIQVKGGYFAKFVMKGGIDDVD